jgi:hypothetical protein
MATAFYPLGMISHSNRSNPEGYVSWKGSDNYQNPISITSGNIRPLTNNDPTNDAAYSHGLPRPIKHYRRGTIADPSRMTNSHRVSISQTIDTPGGFVQNAENTCGNTFVSSWSPIINLTEKPQLGKMSCDENNRQIGGEVQKALNRTRTASTILKPGYYQTSSEHLYNRCSTFDQIESHYRPTVCGTKCTNDSVYKPSNPKFATQGAVSSSTRLLDLQRNAITKGSSTFEPKPTPCVQYRRRRI